jgi:hypothetical protein
VQPIWPLQKQQEFFIEHYPHNTLSSIGMFGFEFKTMVSKPLYYSLSISEAIYGNQRSGYAVATLGLGVQNTHNNFTLDHAIHIGSGGGGHLSQYVAGGLSFKWQSGIIFTQTPGAPSFYIGYLNYPYGSFQAFFSRVGVSIPYTVSTKTPTPLAQSKRAIWELSYKSFIYKASTQESLQALGGQRKKMITNNLYWGESGYAAISNGRFGYIEVGFMMGYRYDFEWMRLDTNIQLGAGGGGGYDDGEGSGALAQLCTQFELPLTKNFSLSYDIRYVNYISGNIASWGSGFGLQYHFGMY